MPPRPPSAANNGSTAWPDPLRRGWCATDTGLRAIVSAGVVAIEAIAESGVLGGNLDRDQAPGGAGLIARGAELPEQLLAGERHCRELFQPGPQPLQLAPPDCPLLGDTVAALRQNVELAFLRQELDLHAGSRLLPRLSDQMLLQARQAALRRAH